MSRMLNLCGHDSMSALGTTNGPLPTTFDLHNISVRTDRSRLPMLRCPKSLGLCIQMIQYRKPSPHKMQYVSLTPISLELGDKERLDMTNDTQAYLIEKMKLHTVIKRVPTEKELTTSKIISQINCSRELSDLMLKNIHLIRSRMRRKMSVSERVVESAASIWDLASSLFHVMWSIWLWPVVTTIFKTGLICHRCIAEVILCILEWRPGVDSAALKDISATAQQLDIRLQQFCYWPMQYLKLRSKRDDWESVTDSHPDYIRFYNSLWLVANDVIIGIAFGAFIVDNAEFLAFFLNRILSEWTITGLKGMIEWLTDWPAGLKLNNELASFLADLVLWVIEYWTYLLLIIQPLLPHIIYFVGFSSFAGATLPIALFSDLLDLLTIHIHAFYIASARIFHWQLTIIISLFHLFRGKKNNVLRNRIDSCDYDLDQLLFGTILFTLLVFLLPTVVVFYLTFACSRMAIITLTAVLETALAFLNHFPLFALMLRFKDSRRLPGMFYILPTMPWSNPFKGGISFDLHDTPLSSNSIDDEFFPPTSFITLQVFSKQILMLQ